MPMPKRRKGESEKAFIKRCMADATMNGEYPDAAQRLAVCKRQVTAAADQTPSTLQFVTDPGAITIEAAAAAEDGKPAIPRFSMLAYTGGPMRVSGWRGARTTRSRNARTAPRIASSRSTGRGSRT